MEKANERGLNSWIFTIYVWDLDSSESYMGKEKKRTELDFLHIIQTHSALSLF